jgi:DHA2 family multidrug resistance protein-like MFS transporter
MSRSEPTAASIFAVLSAMALVVLDAGLINVALPSLAQSLQVSPAQAILAISSYQGALVVGLLPSAHLAERFGNRQVFIAGLLLFTVASIACAFATSVVMLVGARTLQGLGGAAIMALGIALLRVALGADRLGQAIGWNALTVAACSAAGPLVGAAIVSIAPWPWLFLIKLPLAAASLLAAIALPKERRRSTGTDLVSIGLHAGVFGGLVIAAEVSGANKMMALGLAGLAIGLAAAMIYRSKRAAMPVWPLDLLQLRPLRTSVAASICCFTAQSTGLIALPFYLQWTLGSGPLTAGAILSIWPLTVAATSVAANRLSERFGSPTLCMMGALILGSGLLLSALHSAESMSWLAIGAALSGLGFGLFQVPNNRTLFLTAPAHRSAAAGGLQGTARLAGQTGGALLMGRLFADWPAQDAAVLGLAVGSVFALAAAAISMLAVPRPKLRSCRLRSFMV